MPLLGLAGEVALANIRLDGINRFDLFKGLGDAAGIRGFGFK